MTNPQDSQSLATPQFANPSMSKSIKLKKDALYKPLLRSFRAFFRKLIDIIGLSKGCHHWSNERLRKQVWIFMSFLELPACFMDQRSFTAIVVILFPTIIKKDKNSKQYLPELSCFSEIRHACYDVFQENNVKKRRTFFSDPLMKYLWKLFIVLKPQAIVHHLRRIRSYPLEGEQRFITIFVDMQELEKICDVKILPPEAIPGDAIKPLTQDELEMDLDENGKFNRRTTEAIREAISRQNRLAA